MPLRRGGMSREFFQVGAFYIGLPLSGAMMLFILYG